MHGPGYRDRANSTNALPFICSIRRICLAAGSPAMVCRGGRGVCGDFTCELLPYRQRPGFDATPTSPARHARLLLRQPARSVSLASPHGWNTCSRYGDCRWREPVLRRRHPRVRVRLPGRKAGERTSPRSDYRPANHRSSHRHREVGRPDWHIVGERDSVHRAGRSHRPPSQPTGWAHGPRHSHGSHSPRRRTKAIRESQQHAR